ncbi:hypothetical protein B0H16DRAFT_1465357 [Mycena metata]|uniref:Uncharacterized protein n=1 Tax=Mycena metata TaxID=1033252 RepID=A0AAD7ID61_9AGAR|nr:hypothetical protein B0H16DRAFT_1465357 [Mycena metata]
MFPGFWFTSSSKTLGTSAPATPPRLVKIFSQSKLPRSTGFRPRFEPFPRWERTSVGFVSFLATVIAVRIEEKKNLVVWNENENAQMEAAGRDRNKYVEYTSIFGLPTVTLFMGVTGAVKGTLPSRLPPTKYAGRVRDGKIAVRPSKARKLTAIHSLGGKFVLVSIDLREFEMKALFTLSCHAPKSITITLLSLRVFGQCEYNKRSATLNTNQTPAQKIEQEIES